MKFVFFLLVLAVIGANAKPRAQTGFFGGGGISGGVQLGGYPLGTGVGGSGNGQIPSVQSKEYSFGAGIQGGANGGIPNSGAELETQFGGTAKGSLQIGGCSIGAEVEGSANGRTVGGGAQLSAPGCNDTPKGYTYIINAGRSSVSTKGSKPEIRFNVSWEGPDSIIYSAKIDDEHPLKLGIEVYQGWSNVIYKNDPKNRTNACNDPDDNNPWDFMLVNIVQETLMPDGHCPVEKGEYDSERMASPITVTFPEMINCGDYYMWVDLYRGKRPSAGMVVSFTIDNDGNCTPADSD